MVRHQEQERGFDTILHRQQGEPVGEMVVFVLNPVDSITQTIQTTLRLNLFSAVSDHDMDPLDVGLEKAVKYPPNEGAPGDRYQWFRQARRRRQAASVTGRKYNGFLYSTIVHADENPSLVTSNARFSRSRSELPCSSAKA